MKKKNSKVVKNSAVESDLISALDRLVNGKPTNEKLAIKSLNGALKINFSTVALEAGRSRVLIGMDNCAYPKVRQAVQIAMQPIVETRTAEGVIKNLRMENATLRSSLRLRDSENAALLLRMRGLEVEAKRLRVEIGRSVRLLQKNEKSVKSGKVLSGSATIYSIGD